MQPAPTTTLSTPAAVPVEPVAARADTPPSAEMKAMLDAHNARRKDHCAPPLVWSNDVAAIATKWADDLARRCTLEHSGNRKVGENLAAGTPGVLTPEAVSDMWYEEVSDFNFATGGFAMKTGHFTQLVWISTQRLGCAKSTCKTLDIWVCNYSPHGNVQGQYRENVKPKGCRK